MDSNFSERRKHVRVPARLQARIQILIPEETFSPHVFEGHTRDICLSGLCFATNLVPEDLFLRIIRKIRNLRIWMTLPGHGQETRLFGRAAWVRRDEETATPTTVFGIAFEELNGEQTQALNAAVIYFRLTGTRPLSEAKLQVEIEPPEKQK